jgi:hypothetical protein
MLLRKVKYANTTTLIVEDNQNCLAYIKNAKTAVEISFKRADEILELSDEDFFTTIFNLVRKAEKKIKNNY